MVCVDYEIILVKYRFVLMIIDLWWNFNSNRNIAFSLATCVQGTPQEGITQISAIINLFQQIYKQTSPGFPSQYDVMLRLQYPHWPDDLHFARD